ncbi:Nuclear transport factor 2 [Rhizophlyctis rosea]|uniref:Nuclear transport factor 2 n=1 Tax=Rhizophlyctis rosea TaxID=64517 RepID=A0AAD5S468_9FUNG|nr:Nuclear transport factor 2 [Rhizophlyctis rosea]
MTDPNVVAKAFTDYYYQTFDADRTRLAPLYRPESMLSFEGAQTAGAEAIVKKLVELPLQGIQHKILTTDAQPSNPQAGSLLVTVTGQLITAGNEANPQFFTQTFQLIPDGSGSYWVFNDVFRLCYGM